MAGGGVATFLASFIVHRYDRRLLTLWGLLLIALGSAVSVWANQFEVLLVSRAVTGIGEGAVTAAVISSMAGTRWPERNFGIWTIVNMAAATLLFFLIMPGVMDLGGISGVFTAYLCLTIPGFLLVAWYPRHRARPLQAARPMRDRKSTRLNSSHSQISYAVFCLKKKKLHNAHRAHIRR